MGVGWVGDVQSRDSIKEGHLVWFLLQNPFFLLLSAWFGNSEVKSCPEETLGI